MPAAILATKLSPPPLRQKTVPRPHLLERLNQGLSAGYKLTLVSAPAGFGKTTLLSEWIHQFRPGAIAPPQNKNQSPDAIRAAWLSLDQSDNDLVRFLMYLIAALHQIAPEIGAGALAALQSPQPPPTEPLLTALLNEIALHPKPIVLVLDDYHVIEEKAIDDALAFLLEHLPPHMHPVIATREDPDLPLARLRARDQLVELRASQLRFTQNEAAEFINRVMGLGLAAHDIAALETRTEGWIAGLQLAALALQGQMARPAQGAERDTSTGRAQTAINEFINSFAGSHRYVLDYLVGEVLERRPERERNFLLQTSILDRMCGALCDAVTTQVNSGEMLDAFERSNLFVIPLDGQRQWYRYHHLFAQVLQARLTDQGTAQVRALHRRAAAWYERSNLFSDAIHHTLAAEDFEHAADLIELHVRAMYNSGLEATWVGWVKQLPEEIVRVRPVLNVYYAFGLLPADTDAAGARLDLAEQWLNVSEHTETPPIHANNPVIRNESELRSLPGTIAIARAYRAGAMGDAAGIVDYAQQALALLPETDYLWRGAAAALVGIAYSNSGDPDAAHQIISEGVRSLDMAGGLNFSISGKYLLADLRLQQGHLNDAKRTAEQSLHRVAKHGAPVPQGTADLHIVLSEVHLERNELQAAQQHLETAGELGPFATLVESQHRRYCVLSRLCAARGDLEGALARLDEAEQYYVGGPTLQVQPIPALRATLLSRQGKWQDALDWAHEQELGIDDELSFAREFEHITFARILIAQAQAEQNPILLADTIRLLERLLPAAQEKARLKSSIEILVLRALAARAQKDLHTAPASLERALSLAEPEGFVRIFADEGAPMAELLQKLRPRDASPRGREYLNSILAAFQTPTHDKAKMVAPPSMTERLSERELDVLILLRTEMNGPEIARELSVSLNTVRTHTKNIYSKLGVNNRRAAVRRAQELGLL